MTIPFAGFFERVCAATDVNNQNGLALALGVNRSAVTQAKLRDAVPQKWVLALARKYGLSPDWIEFGRGGMHDLSAFGAKGQGKKKAQREKPQVRQGKGLRLSGLVPDSGPEELISVPKVSARLCAGGGSFEVDATPVSACPFPRWWLARMGSPSEMVFMDVVGDSMEPTVYDGDTVLVDQGNTRLTPSNIFAVGVDDSIYLKRVETVRGGVVLHSDNPQYAPLELCGDELSGFRVIGKMVWLCRDCR